MTSYMYVPDLKIDPTVYPETLPFSFPLDPFQKHAVSAIYQGHNVLICAKTGSGKTLVGEYQIEHSLSKNKRIFYTTPIKSLSNQKFHDLKEAYGKRATVGILTGDIKFCPDADIIVMTTEILRNLLYKKGSATEHLGLTASLSLDNLDAVIFDECHYINDKDRGKVWEETMILLPREVKLVMLSATLDHPELFASWLGELKETPISLIQTTYRIVPLTHTVIKNNNFLTIMDADENFAEKTYSDWVKERELTLKEADDFKTKVASVKADASHKGGVSGKVKPMSFVHQMNETINLLQTKNLLPAIFFVLSRKACETYASKVSATLLTSSETAALNHIISFHLHSYKALETLPQYHTIRDLLLRGIAFHHSGVLPVLKEIIEIAFTKGYVKVLFATETFAVGLNMPTKTVIFTGLQKYDSSTEGMRMLRSDEYTQMAGRAGRRGKDKFGLVIYLPDRDPVTTSEMKQMMKGGKPSLQSRMDFHYDFLLKTLQAKSVRWLEIMERSYWFRQRQRYLKSSREEYSKIQEKISAISLTLEEENECRIHEQIENEVATTVNAKKKNAQKRLAEWQEVHSGPKWTNARRLYKTKKNLLLDAEKESSYIRGMESHQDGINPIVEFLKKIDYIKNDSTKPEDLASGNLTLKGILATEINEANPILFTELFLSGKAHELSGNDLLAVLSTFLEINEKAEEPSFKSLHVSEEVKNVLAYLDDTSYELRQVEKSISRDIYVPGYWDLTLQQIEPIQRWMNGDHIASICSDYEIFEGNFTRSILKMANLLDEWLALATYCEHVSQIEKITALKSLLVRDVVVPDSIYLRL